MIHNYKGSLGNDDINNKRKRIFTHFLHLDSKKNYKDNITNFNSSLDENSLQNCLSRLQNKETGVHSVITLCDYIKANPIEVFKIMTLNHVIVFFDYITILETQKQVLSAICFLLQLLNDDVDDHVQKIELISRLEFYSHIKILIDTPTDSQTQQLAICCALYSLELGENVRKCMFENEIYDVLMKETMKTDTAEYLRAHFFKIATKYCSEMSDIVMQSLITFLFNLLKSDDEIIICEAISALDNSFSFSFISFQLIKENHIIDLLISYLDNKSNHEINGAISKGNSNTSFSNQNNPENNPRINNMNNISNNAVINHNEECGIECLKLKRATAKILFSLIQVNLISFDEMMKNKLIFRLLNVSKVNDKKLSFYSFRIIKFIYQDPEMFDLFEISNIVSNYNFSETFSNTSFEIKMDLLTALQLFVFCFTAEQIQALLTEPMLSFLCDLLNSENCGVSADICHVLSMALSKNLNADFLQLIIYSLNEYGGMEILISQTIDPDNNQADVNHITQFLKSLGVQPTE